MVLYLFGYFIQLEVLLDVVYMSDSSLFHLLKARDTGISTYLDAQY